MADYITAEDAILGTLRAKWEADTPALAGGTAPHLVYETTEKDLTPHPRDSNKAWARVTVRNNDAAKATLRNSEGVARYRRWGLVWIQVFVPAKSGDDFTTATMLAQVAQRAYEGKRALGGAVVFTRAAIEDKRPEGAWVRKDVKVIYYFDEVR